MYFLMDNAYWDTAIDRSMVGMEVRGRFMSKGTMVAKRADRFRVRRTIYFYRFHLGSSYSVGQFLQ